MQMQARYFSFLGWCFFIKNKGSVFPIAFPAPTDPLRPVLWMAAEIVFMAKWDPSLLWTTQSWLPLMARSQVKPVKCSLVVSHTLLYVKQKNEAFQRQDATEQLWLADMYVGNQRCLDSVFLLKHLGVVAGGRAKWAFMAIAESG